MKGASFMKKSLAAVAAMAMVLSFCIPGFVTAAALGEKLPEQDSILLQNDVWGYDLGSGDEELVKEPIIIPKYEEENVDSLDGNDAEENTESKSIEYENNKAPVTERLEIPQAMAIVIDPWEIDGKEQIYSEQYVVKNSGETAGILVLSGRICKQQDKDDVVVKANKERLHDDEVKSVYMEMEFGNGDKVVMLEEDSKYQVELESGEELKIRFTGEVNENASRSWEDGDITVNVVYSWSPQEKLTNTENLPEKSLEDEEEQKLEEETKDESDKEEEIKSIDLYASQSQEITENIWKIGEDKSISSMQYKLCNAGDTEGVLVLSDLICRPDEDSGIAVQTEKEKLHNDQEKAVYMELVIANEANYVLKQESEEENRYIVNLKPGEEVTFFFAGELDGIAPEELQEGDITVLAVCSWEIEEEIKE